MPSAPCPAGVPWCTRHSESEQMHQAFRQANGLTLCLYLPVGAAGPPAVMLGGSLRLSLEQARSLAPVVEGLGHMPLGRALRELPDRADGVYVDPRAAAQGPCR